LEYVYQGLQLVLAWPAIGWLFAGVFVGLFFGATPGLSGVVGLAILLPFTYDMDAGASAFCFLLGMYAITTTSDTLASVLLGVPGTGASQATILDGYPMAMRGEASRAFGAAFSVSAFGGILGALLLGVSIPLVKPIIMAFASPEYVMLGVLGLTMVGSLSGSSVVKGVLSALFGLLVTTVGYSIQGGSARYYFGWNDLLEGLPLIPVVLGLFALPEVIALAVSAAPISRVPKEQVKGGMLRGVKDSLENWWLVLRSCLLGMYIGVLPGLGGSIVDWVAYGHAVQSAKDKSMFGKGDVRGVIAPEAANNAMKGGVIIPTVAFGIPGNAAMAIMLGAFVIQGITPGPQMLESQMDITFSLVWILVIANVVGAGLLMVWGNQLCKLTFVRGTLIVPGILFFVMMGAWMGNQVISNWYMLLLFGLIGYFMKIGGWPRPPMILGFVLGPIMENAIDVSYQTHGMAWLYRPIVVVLAVLSLAIFIASVIGIGKRKKSNVEVQADLGVEKESPRISLAIGIIGAIIFIYCLAEATNFTYDAAFFPISICIPALLLIFPAIYSDFKTVRVSISGTAGSANGQEEFYKKSAYMFLIIAMMIISTLFIGQKITLCGFIFLFLFLWAREPWWMATLQTVGAFLILEFVFDQLISVMWYSPIFEFGT